MAKAPPPTDEKSRREARLAEALRANLRRRKSSPPPPRPADSPPDED